MSGEELNRRWETFYAWYGSVRTTESSFFFWPLAISLLAHSAVVLTTK